MTSWSSHRPNNGHEHGDLSKRTMYRASTAPAGYPVHPRALLPGHVPQTIDRSDLFFTNASRMPIANDVRHTPFSPPPPLPPSPYHTTQNYVYSHPPPVPPLPPPHPRPHPGLYFQRSLTSPPPVPPKPSRDVISPVLPHPVQIPSISTPTSDSLLHSPGDEDDLAIALALSQSESNAEQIARDSISTQEEEDLAKALAASLSLTNNSTHFQSQTVDTPVSSPRDGPSKHSTHSSPSQLWGDEACTRKLAISSVHRETPQPPPTKPTSENDNTTDEISDIANRSPPKCLLRKDHTPNDVEVSTPIASSSKNFIPDDEALARQIALEEESYESYPVSTPTSHYVNSIPRDLSALPGYTPRLHINSSVTSASESKLHTPSRIPEGEGAYKVSQISEDNNETPTTERSPPPIISTPPTYAENTSSSMRDLQVTTPSNSPNLAPWGPSQPPTGPSNAEIMAESSSAQLSISSPIQANSIDEHSSQREAGPSGNIDRVSSIVSLSDSYESDSRPSPRLYSEQSPSIVNVNHFVDRELFMGVSIGFSPPKISAQLTAMSEVMPHIISLPYGRCPPLHLQGPSWRHLLKLMARLSGTRLEPTVEALAISKIDLRLRTVIQFVKPFPSSPDWRTVFYFTLDYPTPRNVQAKNGVNDLPHSYNLSSIPQLLRDASDTPVSKTYTIPSSESVPYPTLPITFPNLAMYLHAALEESRRYLHDSSSGYRKLAKMLQTCYRADKADDKSLPDVPERSGVGGLFKRVIGRGNNKSNSRRGGNEDTYELVTPFVSEEWG